MKKKKNVKSREADTLAKLAAFTSALQSASKGTTKEKEKEKEKEDEVREKGNMSIDDDDSDDETSMAWMTHKVKFVRR